MKSRKRFAPGVAAAICIAVVGSVQAQDIARGKMLFDVCAGCHGIETRVDDQAPSLGRVIGRRAGTLPDFQYSSAMLTANFVWDESRLDRFLADPQAVVPGTRMPIAGIQDKNDRADIIAYVKTLK